MNYKRNIELAKDMCEIAIGAGQLDQVLLGAPIYRIEVPNTAGGKDLATNIIMDALYELHKENPAKQYGKLFEKVLVENLRNVRGSEYMELLLRTLEYQLYAEKNGLASFKINYERCYEAFGDNLQENQQFYNDPRRKDEWFGMVEMHEQIIQSDMAIN